jgi:hypothetical protein
MDMSEKATPCFHAAQNASVVFKSIEEALLACLPCQNNGPAALSLARACLKRAAPCFHAAQKANIVLKTKERALLACLPCQNKRHAALSPANNLSKKGGTTLSCCFKRAAFTFTVFKQILSQIGYF